MSRVFLYFGGYEQLSGVGVYQVSGIEQIDMWLAANRC